MVTLSLQIKLNIANTEHKRLELSTCHVEPDLSLFPNALNDPSFLMYVSCLWYPEITYNNITNLVCYTYFHWFFNTECQHIFGKQTGYIFQSPKTIKTWTTKQ